MRLSRHNFLGGTAHFMFGWWRTGLSHFFFSWQISKVEPEAKPLGSTYHSLFFPFFFLHPLGLGWSISFALKQGWRLPARHAPLSGVAVARIAARRDEHKAQPPSHMSGLEVDLTGALLSLLLRRWSCSSYAHREHSSHLGESRLRSQGVISRLVGPFYSLNQTLPKLNDEP